MKPLTIKKNIIHASALIGAKKRKMPGETCKKGFGLMEVLLSAVIIIIILSALVTIGRAAVNNNESLAERAQAIYLAQEGLEMVRQIRDTNWIDGSNETKWDTLVGTSVANSGLKYKPTYSVDRFILSAESSGEEIATGLSGQQVIFNRKITISPSADIDDLLPNVSGGADLSDYALEVKATVTWTFSGRNKSVELSEILTNWRPDF